MSRPNYAQLEQRIIQLFENEGAFILNDETFTVEKVGKPTASAGECKTDVYISGSNSLKTVEIKLSVKTNSTNEFQENKIGADRAESIFGVDYKDIICAAVESIKERFTESPLVTVPSYRRTPENSFKVGWKLELASKSRTLSAPLQLTDAQIKSIVYKGENLPESKKNAIVNGEIIRDSGVADYIIYTEIEDIQHTSDVIHQMQLIDQMEVEQIYLIFTSNNYRTNVEFDRSRTRAASTDGKRPLAVYVDWQVINDKISSSIVCDPFEKTGYEVKEELQEELRKIGKQKPEELSEEDFHDPRIFNY